MAESQGIEELRQYIGKSKKVEIVEVDKSMIKKLAKAIGDSNPLWQDDDYASSGRYGSIVAPPAFTVAVLMSGSRPDIPLPYKRILAGGGEWEFSLPIKPGDTITNTISLIDAYEREGKTGKMALITFEYTHQNQKGEVVGKSRMTMINY